MTVNVISLDLSKNELKAGLEALKRDMNDYIEAISLTSHLRKAKYDAHIQEGFTPDQALEICKGDL